MEYVYIYIKSSYQDFILSLFPSSACLSQEVKFNKTESWKKTPTIENCSECIYFSSSGYWLNMKGSRTDWTWSDHLTNKLMLYDQNMKKYYHSENIHWWSHSWKHQCDLIVINKKHKISNFRLGEHEIRSKITWWSNGIVNYL